MSTLAVPSSRPPVIYPESDGQPIAENTLQYQWIVTITGGLEHLFTDDPNVFVAADLFWYPVEGRPDIRIAPDTLVAFGRPKGHRGSYRQWEEGGVAPQVVFEVLSPGNRFGEMLGKLNFYRRYGVEEYYLYDPDPVRLELTGFARHDDDLVEISTMQGHVSPRLGITFRMEDDGLHILRPDGRPFITFEELAHREQAEHERANHEHRRAEEERRRADRECERAEQAIRELEQLRQRQNPQNNVAD